MSVTLKGLATVHGISGAVTYSAIAANGALEIQSAQVTDQADIRERLDKNGEFRGAAVRNRRKEITITCLATVSTGSSYADAKKAIRVPDPMTVVDLSAFEEASGAGINGSYVYKSGGQVDYGDDWARLTLPLVKYDHETAANLTAAVGA